MTGLIRSVGRTNLKVLPKEVQNPLDRYIDKKSQKVRFGPKAPPPPEPPAPLPDEEMLEKARQRRRSRRAGGRAATVLAGGDTDTVG